MVILIDHFRIGFNYFFLRGVIPTFNSDGSNVIYQCKLDEFSIHPSDWKEFIDKEYVDSSISKINSTLKRVDNKTSEIISESYVLYDDLILLSTDDDAIVTSISAEKTMDESDLLEFCNDSKTETYAKIGTIDGSSGLFVDNIYDLNGNPILKFDLSNDILILGGKKYKMIPFIEET